MRLSPAMQLDGLVPGLHLLCREASISGQTRDLVGGADAIASILRDNGMDAQIVTTGGAPVVVGRFDAGVRRTLLIYGHYDVAPVGMRKAWSHHPFQLTERGGVAYGRGVITKGEVMARAGVIGRLIEHHSMPYNICFVVEGEYYVGSPHLHEAVPHLPPFDVALWDGGDLQPDGLPVIYSGAKGLLQTMLQASGPAEALPLRFAASVPNPIWTLTWALASIKSEFEELLPEGFYDDVLAPDRGAMQTLQGLDSGEADRRRAWQIERFVTNMTGSMLQRTESFSPTCNISDIAVDAGAIPSIPRAAMATLQFQLVPAQEPATIWTQLETHIAEHEWPGLALTRLPGSYPGQSAAPNSPWATAAVHASALIFGRPAPLVPLAPLNMPVAVLAPGAPMVAAGLLRPTSATFGPDEALPLADLEQHMQFLAEWIVQSAAR